MECSPEDLVLRLAQHEDYEGILGITREEVLWGGMDYLPFTLENWLKEAEDESSNRRNFVFVLIGNIVGFVSIYFQNDGKVGAKFAFRVSKELRGKGYGKQITNLLGEHLKEKYPTMLSIISAIPDNDLSDDEIKSPKHGKLLTVKSVIVYKVRYDHLKMLHPSIQHEKLIVVSKPDFSNILKNDNSKCLLENNLVHINWVPIILETNSDVEFAVRKNQVVLSNGALKDDIQSSFSILTLPYSVPNGNTRSSIDIFTKDKQNTKNHITRQLMVLAEELKSKSLINDSILSIFVCQHLVETVFDVMENHGLQKYHFVYGVKKRKINNMYVYQKYIT